jgi:hypothetical protein
MICHCLENVFVAKLPTWMSKYDRKRRIVDNLCTRANDFKPKLESEGRRFESLYRQNTKSQLRWVKINRFENCSTLFDTIFHFWNGKIRWKHFYFMTTRMFQSRVCQHSKFCYVDNSNNAKTIMNECSLKQILQC